MPIVTTKDMLLAAQANGYAVPAFNVENMEMVQAAMMAAAAQRSPLIIQTTPSTLKYASPTIFFKMAEIAALEFGVSAAIHLDHGDSFQLCSKAYRAGYSSIMIDGSQLPLEENILLTKKVIELTTPANIPVEAELGVLGGKEDSHVVADKDALYTDPAQAALFAEKTGVHSLALAVGTAHGHYKGTPVIDYERIAAVRKIVAIPLVLHGTSGVPEEAVRKAVECGISKVNYATELRDAYTNAVREILTDAKVYDPKAYGKLARQRVQEAIEHKMKLCGSNGKA
ncbi:MAG: class II fructose-bisphosphate aldolase [Deferribacteraceae bacterium]|nr:class II fructose-bisphosphate aldolase [Deferribacteraceae bacterium]